ncbi:hypothetical protein EYC80_003234 [Monilinia laxa]|uniref:Uncharacterized protein n=1 Tax=Monilinia laxa TaxID=61186 RepID=A0A5N6KD71_MONLA|nr:hypothetical protein EYC80_003234 [Monilinia laxa]
MAMHAIYSIRPVPRKELRSAQSVGNHYLVKFESLHSFETISQRINKISHGRNRAEIRHLASETSQSSKFLVWVVLTCSAGTALVHEFSLTSSPMGKSVMGKVNGDLGGDVSWHISKAQIVIISTPPLPLLLQAALIFSYLSRCLFIIFSSSQIYVTLFSLLTALAHFQKAGAFSSKVKRLVGSKPSCLEKAKSRSRNDPTCTFNLSDPPKNGAAF